MKVILTREVKSLGQQDDIVNVAEGYARNYLLPQRMAVPATEANLAELDRRLKLGEKKGGKLLEDAKAVAERLEGIEVTLRGKVGAGTKLYGAITAADIAAAVEEAAGVKVDKRKVELGEPIKTLGSYTVPIRLHRESTAEVKVEVVAEPDSAD